MSRITQVTYKRHVNAGNFESFEIEATAIIEEGEHPRAVATMLQAYVDTTCNERVDAGKRGARGGLDVGEAPEF